MTRHRGCRWFALLWLCAAAPGRADAAEADANCTGFIDSVPAFLGSPGYYCLRGDVSTANASGAAITLLASGITIDCRDYKLGGLAAGTATSTYGISASFDVRDATVRNCNVRGFRAGVSLYSADSLVEDSRFDGNTEFGIVVQGKRSRVRRNQVRNTGGSTRTANYSPVGIWIGSESDASDNLVAGVRTHAGAGTPTGIRAWDSFEPNMVLGSLTGNRITGLQAASGARHYAIHAGPGRAVVSDNQLVVTAAGVDAGGVYCNTTPGTGNAVVRDNTLRGFTSPVLAGCVDGGGNVSL